MLPHHHLYGPAWGAAGLLWVLCGTLLVARRAGGESAPRVLATLAVVAASALLGARLHHLLLSPDLLRSHGPAALLLSLDEGAGLRIGGGLLAALALLFTVGPWAVRRRIGRAELCDLLVPLGGLAVAIGRLGCFADGCCFGTVCAHAWCVVFPAWSPAYWSHVAQGHVADGSRASLSVHPLQLYLGAAGLAAFAAGALVTRRSTTPGTAALVSILVLTLLRTLVEPLRETSFGAGVPYQATLDLSCAALAGVLLVARSQRSSRVLSGAGS